MSYSCETYLKRSSSHTYRAIKPAAAAVKMFSSINRVDHAAI